MKNKNILIPGWMNSSGMYMGKETVYDVLEVWQDKIFPEEKIEAEYLIGHSLGCNYVLRNWEKNKNAKLILINPLLPKRNMWIWFLRWRKFRKMEIVPESKVVVRGIGRKFFGARECLKLLRKNFDEMLDVIPKESLTIICGEKDDFYCDEEFKKYIKLKSIKLIEVDGVGHDWNEKFDLEIENIIR